MNELYFDLKVLGNKNKITILLCLNQFGKMKSGDIRIHTSYNNRTTERLFDLEKLGLIALERSKEKGNTLYAELTEKGKEIAELISICEKNIENPYAK